MSAVNNTVPENDLEEGQNYAIKRRGIFIASGKFTGRYAQGGILGNNPIFKIGDVDEPYARGRYSFYREVKGGRRRSTRSMRRRSTRRSIRK